MVRPDLWEAGRRRVVEVHLWRPRRSRCGELVQWDTSEHDWLEGRGEELYLISMIDDATSRLLARFVRHDSSEENMRLLWSVPGAVWPAAGVLHRQGGHVPSGDQDQTAGGARRTGRQQMPPTQIGRALRELGIVWIPAHSPQAKGRVERQFQTAQDRLVKGMRVAGVRTLEQANAYLENEFSALVEPDLTVEPANANDAHRPSGQRT